MRNSNNADEIASALLYKSGVAMVGGDYELFRSCFSLPNYIETSEGARILETEAAFREAFSIVRSKYEENDVTDMARTVLSAELLATGIIGSTHASQLITSGGSEFCKPFPVYSTIVNIDGCWKVASSTYVILDFPALNAALVQS